MFKRIWGERLVRAFKISVKDMAAPLLDIGELLTSTEHALLKPFVSQKTALLQKIEGMSIERIIFRRFIKAASPPVAQFPKSLPC